MPPLVVGIILSLLLEGIVESCDNIRYIDLKMTIYVCHVVFDGFEIYILR